MKQRFVGIIGTSHYLPENIQTNEDLCKVMEDVTPDWIISKTGIKRRYIAGPNESASNMATKACSQLLNNLNISEEEIGLVIVASFSPDYLFPPLSSKIHSNLKLKNAQIIDINTNCTGFVTALTIASDRMRIDAEIKYALVVGVELHTRFINPKDKETAIFFSDGAGVALLGDVPESKGILNSSFYTDSSTYEAVRFRGGGSSFPFTNRKFDDQIDFIEMNGLATWKQAVTNLPRVINNLLTKSNLTIDQIDFCIFHQANKNLINYVMAKMKIPIDRTYTNVEEIGNTGSASVGIALSEAIQQGKIKKGDLVLFAGVGAGFNFGASLWQF